jgi:hypothetical protein
VLGGLSLAGGLIALNVVLIVLGLAGLAYAYWHYRQLDVKRSAIRTQGDIRRKNATQNLNALIAELVDYRTEWDTEDTRAEDAREFLTAISPVDQLNVSPHNAREVV